jgi:hypothetical protein
MRKKGNFWNTVQLAKVTSVAKGIGFVNAEWARNYLASELGGMPGLPAKASQFLNQKSGESSSSAPEPLPLEWVKAKLEADAPALARQIVDISLSGISASLGQVHRATLTDGRVVAIKIQYPDVRDHVDGQLQLLLLAMRKIPVFGKHGLNVSDYEVFFKNFFNHELDYLHEARNQKKFAESWANSDIVVPAVDLALSTRDILVQQFEASIPLHDLVNMDETTRERAARALARVAILGTFKNGLFHTDLHQGNWGFRADSGTLVLYDFGATLTFDQDMVKAFADLFLGSASALSEVSKAFQRLGFDPVKLALIGDNLSAVRSALVAPLRETPYWRPDEWKLGDRLESALGGNQWWLRSACPPWFLLFMRGIFGVAKAIESLNVAVPIHAILKDELGWTAPPSAVTGHQGVQEVRTKLKIKVREAHSVVVSLEMPGHLAAQLEDVMPEHVLAALPKLGISLAEIKARVEMSQFSPQVLFHMEASGRTYRIWLE